MNPKCEKNVYSQHGEDGVIAYIFRHVQPRHRQCVEFGAWDGKKWSNAFALVEQGWKSLMIEGDKTRYKDLLRTQKKYPNIQAVNRYVTAKGKDRLDQLLKEAQVPKDFDLLSIDIDSEDYRVWESLKAFSPSVVIIEYDFYQYLWLRHLHGQKRTWLQYFVTKAYAGNSACSLCELAKEKGYVLVHMTFCNLFFVRKDVWAESGLPELKHPAWALFYKHLWQLKYLHVWIAKGLLGRGNE